MTANSVSNGEASVTTSAARLNASAIGGALAIYALSTNVAAVYVGGSGVTTNNGLPISAGKSFTIDITDASNIYIVGSSGDKVRWLVAAP